MNSELETMIADIPVELRGFFISVFAQISSGAEEIECSLGDMLRMRTAVPSEADLSKFMGAIGYERENYEDRYKAGACETCWHRRRIPGDTHSSCEHPDALALRSSAVLMTQMFSGRPFFQMNRLQVIGDQVGFDGGWFTWPFNYDPTWLRYCNGYSSTSQPPTEE